MSHWNEGVRRRPWEIDRRALLRGAGVAIGLPFLEAMVPDLRRAAAAGIPSPKRLVFFVFQGGCPEVRGTPWDFPIYTDRKNALEGVAGCLRPARTGADYDVTPLLQPLVDMGLKDDFVVVSNLHNKLGQYDPTEDPKYNGGEHPRSATTILTGVKAVHPDGPDTVASISVDQFAASQLGQYTPGLPSLFVGSSLTEVDAYQSVSWSSPTRRLLPVVQPSEAFREVFGEVGADPKVVAKRLAYRQSVLTYAMQDAADLRKKLGKADQDRLETYLASIGDLEKKIAGQATTSGDQCGMGSLSPNDAAPLPARLKQMMDLVTLAFQCDRTRVALVYLQSHREIFNWIDAPYNDVPWHCGIEHGPALLAGSPIGDGMSQDTIEQVNQRMDMYVKGSAWEIEQFGYLVKQLKDKKDADGAPLLDSSIMLCTSELNKGNGHNMEHLPCIMAGRAGGAINPGRHLAPSEQPIANAYLTMLQAAGVDASSFGNSTGPLSLT